MRWLGAAVIATSLVFGGGGQAPAQVADALTQKSRDAGEISSLAAQRGHVRVIVHFDAPVAPTDIKPTATSLANVRARVAARHDAIVAAHFGNALRPAEGRGFARGITRFDITPGFAVNVSPAELQALAADPRVTTINYDRPMPPTLLQSVPLIGMTNAYGLGATGQGQVVAIVDTGVLSNHEFLAGKVEAEACFSNAGGGGGAVTLCPNGLPSQTGAGSANPYTAQCINGSSNLCSHGSHVAGIAAGANTGQSAGEPTNGVAKSAGIMAIQVFTRFNSSTDCSPAAAPCVAAYTSDQILALDYIFANQTIAGSKVASVNMSLGGGPNTSGTCDGDSLKPSIDNLRTAGILTAIAAGNDGSTTLISHPACISSAVAVGSTTKSDTVSSFSNMSNQVAVLAPGGFGGGTCFFGANNNDILSSVPSGNSGSLTSYACFAGTSMATPHVAGAIAAIRTACPSATADQILTALKTTGLAIADTRGGGVWTKPRIRVDLAVQSLGCSGGGSLAVSPASNISASGQQGGPFSPSSFNYTLTASSGSVSYSITGLPTWLDVSSSSGTATTSGTTITFTVNATANTFLPGTYGPATISFNNLTNGQGTQTRTATLTVNAIPALLVNPATNMASTGNQGGPFFPSSFQYAVSATTGSVNYSITGVPSWLNASATSGSVTTSPTTITFTLNATANGLPPGGYNATISFNNTTNGQGNQTRTAELAINSNGSGAGPLGRTFVSGTGSDTGICPRSAPCATLTYALSQTSAGGEINCLDPGEFGGVTITKAVSILCELGTAGVLVSATNGITVNAASGDLVFIEGLDIQGGASGLDGIRFNSGKALHIKKSRIRGFTGNGINFAPGSGSASTASLIVSDSIVADNASGGGILVKPGTGINAVATLTNIHADRNLFGVRAESRSKVNIDLGTFASNTDDGVVAASAGAASEVNVANSMISNNGGSGVVTSGGAASIQISNVAIFDNGTGIDVAGGGAVIGTSPGSNMNAGNLTQGSPNGSALAQQ